MTSRSKILEAQRLDEEEKRKADEARELEKAQIRSKEIETQRILEEADLARERENAQIWEQRDRGPTNP